MDNQKHDKKEKLVIATDDVEIRVTKITPKTRALIAMLLNEAEEKEDLQILPNQEEEKKTVEVKQIDDRDLTEEEVKHYESKIPSSNEILEHIVSKKDFRHSFQELQMCYMEIVLTLGKKFTNQERLYNLFYGRLRRAQNKIKKRYNGKWKDETIMPTDRPKYKVWQFEKKK